MKKEKYYEAEQLVGIRIDFPEKCSVDGTIRDLEKRMDAIQIPKKGLFASKEKVKKICKLKKRKMAYAKIIDAVQYAKKLKGTRQRKVIFYNQGPNNINWITLVFGFKDAETAEHYKEIICDLYSDIKVTDDISDAI